MDLVVLLGLFGPGGCVDERWLELLLRTCLPLCEEVVVGAWYPLGFDGVYGVSSYSGE